VTESDWHELWLSEAFASFFGALFFEHADGAAKYHKLMLAERAAYLKSRGVERPVVDTAEHNLFALLNTNNYQKGAWVLHMLRAQLGDDDFFRGIRRYYEDHRNGNATTADLRKALESTSGKDLGWFFDQWLYQPGYPQLRVTATWNSATHQEDVLVEQVQPASWPTFRLPLAIAIEGRPAAVSEPLRAVEHVEMRRRREVFSFPASAPPTGVQVDPNDELLATVQKL
jgi:aminopeptidase N